MLIPGDTSFFWFANNIIRISSEVWILCCGNYFNITKDCKLKNTFSFLSWSYYKPLPFQMKGTVSSKHWLVGKNNFYQKKNKKNCKATKHLSKKTGISWKNPFHPPPCMLKSETKICVGNDSVKTSHLYLVSVKRTEMYPCLCLVSLLKVYPVRKSDGKTWKL